ncbi:S41 family peptidase [Aquimarina sp. AU58]|uniref:S41 family peptidase n=1 Tax=Aquimarina sp. AU58 TaxID=1874112 RepID=UPI000D646B83|nr:S41 family peptidase [Aquimarina sp. AU58]
MKKLTYIICLLFFISISVYSQKIQDLEYLLDREWKYDPSGIESVAEGLYVKILTEAEKKGDKKEGKELKSNKQEILLSIKELVSNARFKFNSDYTLNTEINGDVTEEKWTYNSDNKTISYVNSTTKEVNTRTIKKLTKTQFVFINQDGQEIIFTPALPKQPFDPLVLKEDLKIYRDIIETAHSGMYLYTAKDTFDLIFKKANERLPKLQNIREFYNLIAGIHTKINCGHSSFYASGDIFSELKSNTTNAFFPFKVKFLKDTLIAAQNYGKLKKGDQILSINGNTTKKITTEAFKLLSSDGYNTTFKYRQLEDDFSTNYFLVFGPQEKFTIAYLHNSDKESCTVELTGIPKSGLENTITENHYEKPYYLEYVDDNTALLTVNTFSTETRKNQKKFFGFLKNSFSEINKKGIKNLILDIRENTGGDDGNDMELASYLIDTHFKENKYRKLSTIDNVPPYPQYLLSQWYDMMELDADSTPETIQKTMKKMVKEEMIKGDDGAYYWREDKVIHRDPAKNKFKGNVFVLTSGRVFSGGGLFSALVRDKSNAIFIGEETGGGYYRHTGSIPLFYNLPNSKLIFSIFIVINEQDVDKRLFPEGSGTVPHHKVYPTIKEFISGKDAVLEKAKQLIKEVK